jgi:hypothetical protein
LYLASSYVGGGDEHPSDHCYSQEVVLEFAEQAPQCNCKALL